MIVYIESQRGCDRNDCITPCGEFGMPKHAFPIDKLNFLIDEFTGKASIHLYGRGEVAGYPFERVQVEGCRIALTNKSFYLAKNLLKRGANVYSRIDSVADALSAPESTGFFSIAVKNVPLFKIRNILYHQPFCVKSYDNHIFKSLDVISNGLSISDIIHILGKPSGIFQYDIPSEFCKIPILRWEKQTIMYSPCVSDRNIPLFPYISVKDVIDSKCNECARAPKTKFILYYEEIFQQRNGYENLLSIRRTYI